MAIYVGYDLFVSDYLVQNGEIGDNFNLGEAPRQLKREIDLLNGVLPDIWISGNTYLYTDMVTYEGIVYRANVNTSSTTLPSVSSEWDDVTYTSVDGLEEFYLLNSTDTFVGTLTITGDVVSDDITVNDTLDSSIITASTSITAPTITSSVIINANDIDASDNITSVSMNTQTIDASISVDTNILTADVSVNSPSIVASINITTPELDVDGEATVQKLIATTSIAGPTLSITNGITSKTLNATTSITTPILTVTDINASNLITTDYLEADISVTTAILSATTSINTPNITVDNLTKSKVFESTQSTGTAPLIVASTTKVNNLNVDLLDGFDSAYFAIATTYDYSTTISGATVFDEIDVTNGQVTNVSTRELTAANIGALDLSGGTITGDLTIEGTLYETSALKYKENVKPLENSLSVINNLVGVSYNKIGYSKTEIGLIADEVFTYRPEYVLIEDGEVEGIMYQRIVADLINAVNILTERVYDLENK